MRLFAALRPDDAAIEHLVQTLRPIRRDLPTELRWTDPDNWHLTLAFYGEQPDGAVEDIVASLGQAAMAAENPLDLHLRGAGVFSHKTLWVGVGGETRRLRALAADAGALLPDTESECRRHHGHLTVARLSRRGTRPARWDPVLDDLARALAVYVGPTFTASEIILYQSLLGKGRGGGPLYEPLATISL